MVTLYRFKQLTSSSLLKNSFVYVVTDGINKAIPFVLLPIISRYLTPSEYGIVTNYNVLISVLSALVFFCTGGVIPVMYFKLPKDKMQVYVYNMLVVNTISVFCCLLIILIFHERLETLLNFSLFYQLSVVLMVWFSAIGYANLLLWRCEEKPFKFGIYNICSSLINGTLTIILVIVLLKGWQGRAISICVASIVMGCFSMVILFRKGFILFKISDEYIKSVLAFSLPIIPHALSFWIKSGADKIMLTDLCGLSENGLYSVAVTWGAIIAMLMASFSNSYSPWLFKKLAAYDKDKEGTLPDQKRLVKMIYLSLAAIFFIVFVLYIISHILIGIMYPESYAGSKAYLPFVMLAQAFDGAYLLFVCFLHYTFRTKILGVTTFTLSVVQIIIAYFLISRVGAIGVAYSSVIGSALTFTLIAIFGMKSYKLPWFGQIKKI